MTKTNKKLYIAKKPAQKSQLRTINVKYNYRETNSQALIIPRFTKKEELFYVMNSICFFFFAANIIQTKRKEH